MPASTNTPTTQARSVYVLRLRAEPGVDPIRSLRALLKIALRRYRLRCVEISEVPEKTP